jgi:hypothetical protein
MNGFDNNNYYEIDAKYKNNYTVVNNIKSGGGERDYKENCNISYEIPYVTNSQNVLWGSQKPVKETCPNINALKEKPSHYAWHNFTKRISVVE